MEQAEETERGRLLPPALGTALALGFVVWGVRIGVQPLTDNSFLTHLATGRFIVDEWRVPTNDIYSFSAPDTAWVVQSWLASAFYGLLDQLHTGHAILVLNGVLCGLLGGLVWRLTRPAVTLLPRLALAAAAVGVGTSTWVERPLLFGLVAMGIVLLMTEEEWIPPWVLVPVLWVWVNSHGSWPLGVALIGARIVGTLVEERRRTLTPREVRLGLFTVVGLAAAAVNPIGPRLLLFPFELVGDRMDILNNILEWRAPDWRTVPQRVFLGVLLMGVILLTRRRGRWADGLVLALFAALALTSTRNIAVANLVVIPIVARGIRDLGTLRGDERGPLTVGMAGAVIALGVIIVTSALSDPAFQLGPYPVQMFARVEAADLEGPVATEDFAGNLQGLLHPPPERAVFIDDRYDMWPRSLVSDYSALLGGDAKWDEVLDEHGIRTVVWDNQETLASLLAASPKWRVVTIDGRFMIAQRR